jgi:hypothetical protein
MTALSTPSFALRQQRDGQRQKPFSLSRRRAASPSTAVFLNAEGASGDCVFKRFPAIGDTSSAQKQQW